MAIFAKQTTGQTKGGRKLVATGKRQKGVWTMESKVEPKAKRSARGGSAIVRQENSRVRTLH
jgi:hypothetical protein